MRKMRLSLMVTFYLLHATLTHGYDIFVHNGGPWGDWAWMDTCPPGTLARGFNLMVESSQGRGDDTALNAIKLYCSTTGSNNIHAEITSKMGRWGRWTGSQWCPTGHLISFSLMVEAPIDGDDTAANNIMFQCSDVTVLMGKGGSWGRFGGWSGMFHGGICGIKTRVEDPQGNGDDTALNNVVFRCC